MTITAREAFQKGTAAFNAHDLDGFAEVLADDVVFRASGGIQGDGKPACAAFFGSWFTAFPDARVEVQAVHIVDDVAVTEVCSVELLLDGRPAWKVGLLRGSIPCRRGCRFRSFARFLSA